MASSAEAIEERTQRRFALPAADSIAWLYVLIGSLAVIHLSMMLGRSINWDEFWGYSQVEQVARGEFVQPLQTIQTRVFSWWLPQLPGNSIDHILIARGFMAACLVIASYAIFLSAEKFSDRRTALIAVAAYLGTGFVLQHGTAFRADPILAACLASAFAIAARSRFDFKSIVAFGALVGFAAMVSIKVVLWAPAFTGLALLRWEEERFAKGYVVRWIGATAVAAAVFAMLYLLHVAGMPTERATDSAARILDNSAGRMFGIANGVQLAMIGKAIFTGLPLFTLALLAPFVVLKSGRTRTRKLALMAIWSVVLVPIFYHNSYAYFYVFLLPAVAIVSVVAVPVVLRRYGSAVVLGTIAIAAMLVWAVDPRGVTERQQVLVDGVHETFGEPVAYFDCCGMIAEFEKANNFRTSWGTETYLANGIPQMRDAMLERPVPLLLDNKREFGPAIRGEKTPTILPEDAAALRETYVPLWGDIYVAGKRIDSGAITSWNVRVPGTYRAEGVLRIGGRMIEDGDTISLKRGEIAVSNSSDRPARLVWGEETNVPPFAPPNELYWTGF